MIKLAFVGDLSLCGRVPEALQRAMAAAPVPDFLARLRGADLAVINLESPFAKEGQAGGWVADPSAAELLKGMGAGLVTLANNHIGDAGSAGIETTLKSLSGLGIRTVGAGMSLEAALAPAVVEIHGMRLGFLAFADGRPYTHKHVARRGVAGAAWLDERMVAHAVSKLRSSVDFVIVAFHHGLNYVHFASPRQRTFAKIASDVGADIVIGHHPHVLQGLETMGGGKVFYSLGEFLLDPAVGNVVEPRWEEMRRLTAVLDITIRADRSCTVDLVPYRRTDQFDLVPLGPGERDSFDRWMGEISAVYADYDPARYLAAASEGVVEHVGKVFRHHMRRGNIGFLMKSVARIRYRHVQILLYFLARRLRRGDTEPPTIASPRR